MKHRSIQFGTRRNPESHESIACASKQIRHPRHSEVRRIRTREEMSLTVPPPMSSSERNRGQVESDAGFEQLLDVVEAARLLRIHPKLCKNSHASAACPRIVWTILAVQRYGP